MDRLTILVDMDEVLTNLLDPWVKQINKLFGTNVNPEDVVEWDITKAFPMLSKEQVFFPLHCDDFWYLVMPKEGAVETVKQLIDDGHKIVVVTASSPETIRTKMSVALFGYFPYLRWNDVIVTGQKQLIKGDVLIDDGIHNLESGDYLKILMDTPYNREYNAEINGMLRVKNWSEIYSVITEFANAN